MIFVWFIRKKKLNKFWRSFLLHAAAAAAISSNVAAVAANNPFIQNQIAQAQLAQYISF